MILVKELETLGKYLKQNEAVWGAIPIQWPGLNLRRNYMASDTAIWQGPHRRRSTTTN